MLYATVAALGAALLLFVWIGLRARSADASLDEYVTARNSQGPVTLGLSFLASGLGAWILFAPPEVGAFVGPVAVAGYALGAALPFLVLAWCGPAIRRCLPHGRSIAEYAQHRFGTGLRLWVSAISVLYMLCFLTAELTAIGAITGMLSGLPGAWMVVGVAATTLAYTAWGGLRASLATDRWQAWLLLALLGLVLAVLLPGLPDAPPVTAPSAPPEVALSVALTLVIAVTAANLFHQGYWQRVWAARDDRALAQGAWLGGASTVLVVAAIGALGVLAASRGLDLGQPPIPFFALLKGAPAWLTLPALLLAVALVASSVDTLQNGIASLVVTARPGVALSSARWATVALMVPVVLVALQGLSVLRLFLIADLLCATAVVPVLMGLWRHTTPTAAVAGALAGVVGAVLPGWVSTGSLAQGLLAASFPGSIPTLAPFAGALVASSLVCGALSVLRKPAA
ncbi:sodium:solute symporter family transporter [Aquabacterium sp. A08]|uniref:sodium:solute symporter family transporter n=1 Tax=Aquabacterium sp. A08 TaxID=2718532 RepID=UPI0014201777|nr:sodium:solute symporter [Aquabacterium sp. A08]NIC40714.1 sodium:solute symporter [Aquabacterium sp. A08]